jgi:hypothetical protein
MSVFTLAMTSMVSSCLFSRSICTLLSCSFRASSSIAIIACLPLRLSFDLPEVASPIVMRSSPEDVESSARLAPADFTPFLADEDDGFLRLGVPVAPLKGSCLLAWSWGSLALTVVGVAGVDTENSIVAKKLPSGGGTPLSPMGECLAELIACEAAASSSVSTGIKGA